MTVPATEPDRSPEGPVRAWQRGPAAALRHRLSSVITGAGRPLETASGGGSAPRPVRGGEHAVPADLPARILEGKR